MRSFLFCIPSLISLSRVFVAFALILNYGPSPSFCLLWAVVSDVLDGAFARYFKVESRVGRYLDPIADKLFALAFVYFLHIQDPFSLFQIVALFSREISLVIFWLGLIVTGQLSHWNVRSFVLGKVMTTLQFLVFFLKMEGFVVGNVLWSIVLLVGIGSFFELRFLSKEKKSG